MVSTPPAARTLSTIAAAIGAVVERARTARRRCARASRRAAGWRSVSPAPQRRAVGVESRIAASAGRARMASRVAGDRVGQVGFDREAVARQGDRRLPRPSANDIAAVASQRGEQAGDLARRRHRQAAVQAELRHGLAVAHEHVAGRRRRRGLAIVERRTRRRVAWSKISMKPPPPMPHEVGLTTQTASAVATAASTALPPRLQDPHAGLRGEPVLGRDHAVAAGQRARPGRAAGATSAQAASAASAAVAPTCDRWRALACRLRAADARVSVSTSTRRTPAGGRRRTPETGVEGAARAFRVRTPVLASAAVTTRAQSATVPAEEFGEKEFYLDEFHSHTLCFAIAAARLRAAAAASNRSAACCAS